MVLSCDISKALEKVEEIKKELKKNPDKYKAFLVNLQIRNLEQLVADCREGKYARRSKLRVLLGDL
jgi:hypothetical protein